MILHHFKGLSAVKTCLRSECVFKPISTKNKLVSRVRRSEIKSPLPVKFRGVLEKLTFLLSEEQKGKYESVYPYKLFY